MAKKCTNGYTIKVLRSAAGYYIGTADEFGSPNCRISANYYKTSRAAQSDLDDGCFIPKPGMEIKFCNGGKGCLIR